ncbi:MAG: ATP-binding cassette domain-containing protein, partial [Chloroflexi bacterium]|nr:ATP-binding cassette domain-containing protein [Chloroflexota bacterium]
ASGGKRILSDVSLSIRPGEFVAVVGGSGNGKTTLVSALCGFKPPSSGKVLFNGQDLARCFGVYRASIGYVPQDNILHGNLTLERALDFAAMLRLPPDTAAAERKQRVEEVLAELDLLPHRDTFIDDLSGGQRKRASIGVELLTRPSLFFLDEPTSGLDPVAETLIMRRLRELADQGRTLILVTHATQNIMLCDRVAFLSRGGRLAFFGRPRDALDFFMVEEFVDAYDKLESEPSVGDYARQYEASPYHERCTAAATPPPLGHTRPAHVQRPSTSGVRQFGILMRRSLELLLAPRRGARQALAVLLLQAPLIARCRGLIFPRAVFHERPIVVPPDQLAAAGVRLPLGQVQKSCDLSPDELAALPASLQADWMAEPCGDTRKAMLMLFLLSIVAIWLGAFNGAKEIIREQAIYRRERLAVLGILPYVCSKIALLWIVSIVQAALLLAIMFGMIDFPPEPNVLLGTTAVILLTFAVATLFGLAISAVASSPEFSQMALPILLLPQMFFAGAMLALGEMGSGARYVSALTLSRWSWESLGAIADLPRYAQAQGGPMLSLLEEHKWRHTFEIDPWTHAQVLGLFGLAFLVVTVVALRRKDAL